MADNGKFKQGNKLSKGRRKGSKNKTVVVRSAGKPLDNTRKKGAALGLPKGGRPKGSKNKSKLLMDQLRTAGPNLLKRLIEIANSGDVPALRTVLAPLIAAASDNPVRWKFGELASLEDLRIESERILRGIEDGTLTPEQGIQLRKLLDGHADDIRASRLTDRRAEFEEDERKLAKMKANPRCYAAAQAFVMELYALELTEVDHPIIQSAVAIVEGNGNGNGQAQLIRANVKHSESDKTGN